MLTGTLTLDPAPLPAACDAVYLLDDADIPADATLTYEASLNGTTWVPITAGQITALGHSGTSLRVRATWTLAAESANTGTLRWLLAYGTTTGA